MMRTNMPFDEYQQLPALNQSKLGLLKTCPFKFKWVLEQEQKGIKREPTPALNMGQAIHAAILEPNTFNERFLCLPDIDRRTTKGKEAYNELVSQNPDKTILKPEEFHTALDVATSVRSNPHCNYLLDGAHTEITLDWVDDETDVPCKARLDAYNENLGIVIDIKTTQDASRSGFPRKLFSYGYHRQAAWYLEAINLHGEQAKHFVFIAVEKEKPYAIGVYRLTDETIRLSRQENQRLLAIYAECMRTNKWPGYTEGIEDISIPEYATNDMEEIYGQSI